MGIEMIRIMNLTPLPFASPLLALTPLRPPQGRDIRRRGTFSLFFSFTSNFGSSLGTPQTDTLSMVLLLSPTWEGFP